MPQQMKFNTENIITRSPRLETVMMVEKFIEETSGEFTKTQLFNNLPKKIMWPTYLTILNYLEDINKIITADNGVITYIWNPKLIKKYLTRKTY